MLYHIAGQLQSWWPSFHLLHYTSFRAMGGMLTALFLSILYGSWFIESFRSRFSTKPREWTPEGHKAKTGLPTMGGIFILSVVVSSVLLWCDLARSSVWIFLVCLLGFGAIGFLDDWRKIKKGRGISSRQKSLMQLAVAFIVVALMVWTGISNQITVPLFKKFNPDLGYLFIAWAIFVLIGTSNAVNLTDGLDGLAVGSLIPNFALFGIISFLSSHFLISQYLHMPFTTSGEITVICGILMGSCLGFLWYNAYPAMIFMGDVGSLSLGAALAFVALFTKQELVLLISGGLFVVETLSVILQVFSYKTFGRRLFKMAPIHHHFELLGWPEAQITTRFGIISLVLCLFALMAIKVR